MTKPILSRCVVGLHHCVGHLWRWNHGECFHDAIRIFLAHFGDQQRSHASTSAAAKRVAKLESLQAITPLSFFSNHIQDRVNQLSTLGVVTLTGCNSWSLNGMTLKLLASMETTQNVANLAFAQLFPAPVWPNTKLSGRNSWPKGPARTLSMVPAARRRDNFTSKIFYCSSHWVYFTITVKFVILLYWEINHYSKHPDEYVAKILCHHLLAWTSWPDPGSRSIKTARGT